MRKIRVDGPKEDLTALKAGESVLITGYVYTSRDAAHKRIFSLIKQGKPLP